MSYSVTQNTFFLTFASILQKVVSFVYFTMVARVIGVENTGQYFFAIAFTTIFTVVADFGFGSVLTRESAKHPENSETYINTLLGTKVVFGLAAYCLVVLFVNLLNYPIATKLLVYVSGVTMFFDSLQSIFYSTFRARRNLTFESVGIVMSQMVTLIIGTFALINGWPLVWLILAYTIPSGLSVGYGAYFGRASYGLKYHWHWNREVFKVFLAMAFPFALAGIISRLYAYTDSILMSKLLPPAYLGWWSVPYKITFAFQFIPVAVAASVYPVMSVLDLTNREEIGRIFAKAWRYLFLIVLPLAFGLAAVAEPLIVKIFGANYLPSVLILKILLISLVFGFLSFITGALLNATNHQTTQTSLLAAALVINVLINLALLPVLGVIGAAVAALVGNFVLCLGGYYFSSQLVKINFRELFKYFQQAFWPALIMYLIVSYLTKSISFIFTIPLGALIYLILILLSGGLSKKMLIDFYRKIFKTDYEDSYSNP